MVAFNGNFCCMCNYPRAVMMIKGEFFCGHCAMEHMIADGALEDINYESKKENNGEEIKEKTLFPPDAFTITEDN